MQYLKNNAKFKPIRASFHVSYKLSFYPLLFPSLTLNPLQCFFQVFLSQVFPTWIHLDKYCIAGSSRQGARALMMQAFLDIAAMHWLIGFYTNHQLSCRSLSRKALFSLFIPDLLIYHRLIPVRLQIPQLIYCFNRLNDVQLGAMYSKWVLKTASLPFLPQANF